MYGHKGCGCGGHGKGDGSNKPGCSDAPRHVTKGCGCGGRGTGDGSNKPGCSSASGYKRDNDGRRVSRCCGEDD